MSVYYVPRTVKGYRDEQGIITSLKDFEIFLEKQAA